MELDCFSKLPGGGCIQLRLVLYIDTDREYLSIVIMAMVLSLGATKIRP